MDQTPSSSPGNRSSWSGNANLASQPTMAFEPGREPSTAPTIPAETLIQNGRTGGDPLVGSVWGDFQVGLLLGRGGMGAVYRGRQQSLDRDVAIKVLPPHLSDNEGFRSRFQLEAKAVASLDSPHIIKVYGAGEAQGHHWFAMEYVEGDDLAVTVRKQGRPSRQVALGWVLQAARGLQAAGELGIIHRDIKPANMMLTKRGVVKLMDFGLVRSTKEAHGLTMTGTVMGTVSYFSPEQGRGDRCDSRTDLYALGVVFYEFLTGRLPFTGEDPTSIIYQHIHVSPTPPREIDPAITEHFQAVVLKCLQKRAEDRYQTASELIGDLECLVRGDHPAIKPAEMARLREGTTLYVPGKRRTRRLAPWILAGTTVTIAAATAVWLARHQLEVSAGAVHSTPAVPSAVPVEPPPVIRAVASPITPVIPPITPVVAPVAVTPAPSVLATVPVPVPPIITPVRPASNVAGRVTDLLANGRYAEARSLAASERTAHPDDSELANLGPTIDQAEGAALLTQARTLVAAGNFTGAAEPLAGAQRLLGDHPDVRFAVTERNQHLASLEKLLAEASAQAQAGEGEAALANLAKAKAMAPTWPAVTATATAITTELARQTALRAKRDAAIQAGAEAFAAGDLAAADQSFATAQDLEPANLAAAAGRRQVAERQQALTSQRQVLAAAIAAKDLAGAEKALAVLLPLLPAAAGVAPEADVSALRARLAEEARLAAELEARRAATAKRLVTNAADPAIPLATVEAEVVAFIADTGGKRVEQIAINAALDDRRQREAVIGRLRDLDQAVVAGDTKTISAIITDLTFATALTGLGKQQDLVFVSTLTAFSRAGNSATAGLSIRNAFANFPETDLRYTCDLVRTAGGWTISAAHPQP